MPLDDDSLELLERRMSERVESRVQNNIFKIYGAIGGGIVAAIAYFGYDIISTAREHAQEYANSAVEPAVNSATEAANSARKQADKATAMIEILNTWMAGRDQALSTLEQDVQKTLQRINTLVKDQEQRVIVVRQELETNEEVLKDQRERAVELYAGKGDLAGLKDELVRLAGEVQALDLRVAGTPPEVGSAPTSAGNPNQQSVAQTAIQNIIEKSDAIVTDEQGAHIATVYFQFAGVERPVAEALRTALAAKNFNMPGEERTSVAAGLHEVRFFFPDDQAAAERLKTSVSEWLSASGYEAEISVRDFTKYARAKPKPGIVELWLEPKRV